MKLIIDLKEVNIPITPEKVAELFCDMDNEQQAIFFNEIGRITKEWKSPLCFQLDSIITSGLLNEEGIKVMVEIGNYGKSS